MSDDQNDKSPQFILISGLAGSGYSTALNVLEDVGFSAVDNLPMALVDKLVSLEVEMSNRKIAVSLDGRTSGFDPNRLMPLMDDLRRRLGDRVKLIFLSAQEDVIYRRFNATRRHHPLNHNDDLMAAIRMDGLRMQPIEALADIAIDTSDASPTQFRAALLRQLGLVHDKAMPVLIQSFSYRHGIPRDADMIFDMRFVDNPHWHPELAEQTGLDDAVQAYLGRQSSFRDAMQHIQGLLAVALPRFLEEGRPKLSVAVGCTGGRHRSVFSAITLGEMVRAMGVEAIISHRELEG